MLYRTVYSYSSAACGYKTPIKKTSVKKQQAEVLQEMKKSKRGYTEICVERALSRTRYERNPGWAIGLVSHVLVQQYHILLKAGCISWPRHGRIDKLEAFNEYYCCRRVEAMGIFPSVCALGTFPHNCIDQATNQPHTPPLHGIQKHATHPMIGCSASERGARATTPRGWRRSGWAVSKPTRSGTSQTALHTTHHPRHTTHHTP